LKREERKKHDKEKGKAGGWMMRDDGWWDSET